MNEYRPVDPPREIEEEADRLLDEWSAIDTPLSFFEYREQFASPRLKEYLNREKEDEPCGTDF